MKKLTLTAAAMLFAAMMTYQPSFAQQQGTPAPRPEPAGGPAARPAPAAQPAAGRDRTSPDEADKNMDQHFAREAAQDNLFEIQASQLAEQRAQSQDVKQFAQMLVQDHQQANQKLQQIAQSKGIDIPKELDEVHQAKLQMMQKMQGKHFEKHFVYGQLAGHVMDVLKFRDASQELQDKDLKQFAATTLPKLQQHLQAAQRLAGWNEAMPASATEHGTGTHSGATPGDRSGTGTSGDRDRTSTPGSSGTDRDRTSTPGSTGGAGSSGTDRSGTNR